MLPRPCGVPFSLVSRAAWLAGIVLLLLPIELAAQYLAAQQNRNNPNRNNPNLSHVVCRENLSASQREELAGKLQRITGWPDLKFDGQGILREGNKGAVGGSASARELIANSIHGGTVTVIEAANKRAEVAFARVIPGRWKRSDAGSPPVFVVQIDFADFDQVVGDERALEAFNVGWGLLHELEHVVNDSADAVSLGETGECEAHLNQMRRECDLPERADYFATLLPLNGDTAFVTKLVRVAFEQQQPQANKKKRYWVIWDANVVGGLQSNQVAALR